MNHWQMYIAIISFIFVITALVTECIDKTIAVIAGALVLGVTNTTPFESMIGMVDFTTITLLLGLMILVEITRQSQILEWLNVHIVTITKGNPFLLYVVFCLLTIVLSTFLANATTMMILIPLTITITRGMGIRPSPYIISEIIFSDIGGAFTVIGDPANVMIGSATHINFLEFSRMMSVPLLSIAVCYFAILIFLYWDDIKPIARSLTKLFMTNMLMGKIVHQFTISNFDFAFAKRTVIIFLCVIFAMLFDLHGYPIEYIALGGAVILLISVRKFINIHRVFESVDVHTLLFFAGLFIIVESLNQTGALEYVSNFIVLHAHTALGVSLLVLWTVGLLSAFVENIPLVAMMIPVLEHTIASGTISGNVSIIWYALSLGACLGGNGSLIGSSANILGTQLAEKNGVQISFMQYFKIGYPLTLISLAISSIFLWYIT